MINTKNVLLVRPKLGKSLQTTRDLPPQNHIYGKKLPEVDAGVKQSIHN